MSLLGGAEALAQDVPYEALAAALDGQVTHWEAVWLDGSAAQSSLEQGTMRLPIAAPGGSVVDREWVAAPARLRAEGVRTGYLRSQDGVQAVPLPPEDAYRVGGCSEGDPSCGAVTVIDAQRGWVHALLVDPELGTSFLEPVDLLLGSDAHSGLHVVYNAVDTLDAEIDDLELCREDDDDCGHQAEDDDPFVPDPEPPFVPRFSRWATRIVLDGDATFFSSDPATWAQRQLAVFNDVALMYGFIEPASVEAPETARWQLDLTVKGQEVWTSGGPTSTDGSTLMGEITDPNYLLLNPVDDDEVHLLLLGYDVTSLFGLAAGIGTASGGLGGAAGKNHAFVVTNGQSAKGQWVTAAHEVGHLIGGEHRFGSASACSNFLGLFQFCGGSIMAAGSAGAPQDRAAIFTDENDRRIELVLSSF